MATLRTIDMNSKQNCVLCGGTIDNSALTFEQKLVNDEDFCRACWNDIMHQEYEGEIPLPHLFLASA
ncbi:MAG TPA: hypothetical protein VH677_02355 [Nitrososphaera sp.]